MLVILKVALSDVLLHDSNLPVPLPPLQANLIWSLENSIMMDELVAYTPHTGLSYEADNGKVYNLLNKDLSVNNATTSITRHQQRRDGSSDYLNLLTHNIGSSN